MRLAFILQEQAVLWMMKRERHPAKALAICRRTQFAGPLASLPRCIQAACVTYGADGTAFYYSEQTGQFSLEPLPSIFGGFLASEMGMGKVCRFACPSQLF